MINTASDPGHIEEISSGKDRLLDLLLIGDEQESMIRRYLDKGRMFTLSGDGGIRAACVVTDNGDGVCELKNIAVYPAFRRRGYAGSLIGYVCREFAADFRQMIVGTGEVPSILRFYERCGFVLSHREEGFFTKNYDHQIIEEGVLLKDMIYLKRDL